MNLSQTPSVGFGLLPEQVLMVKKRKPLPSGFSPSGLQESGQEGLQTESDGGGRVWPWQIHLGKKNICWWFLFCTSCFLFVDTQANILSSDQLDVLDRWFCSSRTSVKNIELLWELPTWTILVGRPTRWSLLFTIGFLIWSSIFPIQSTEKYSIVLC